MFGTNEFNESPHENFFKDGLIEKEFYRIDSSTREIGARSRHKPLKSFKDCNSDLCSMCKHDDGSEGFPTNEPIDTSAVEDNNIVIPTNIDPIAVATVSLPAIT